MLSMSTPHTAHARQCRRAAAARSAGFSLIEVMVSIIIIAIGLLGLAGLQAQAMNSEFESYQRSQAIMLVNDMVERIRMNRVSMGAFKNITDPANGASYLGTAATYAIPPGAPAQVQADLAEWNALLEGSAETKGGNQVGAMIGARGCIWYDASTEIPGVADSGTFTVAIAWQGSMSTVPPAINCGNGLYGNESQRRVVAQTFRMARLSS
jgi:type IV pilus assembly protein PilV